MSKANGLESFYVGDPVDPTPLQRGIGVMPPTIGLKMPYHAEQFDRLEKLLKRQVELLEVIASNSKLIALALSDKATDVQKNE